MDTLSVRGADVHSSLLEVYQQILRSHGEQALLIEGIQHLALAGSGLRKGEDPVFLDVGPFRAVARAASSAWPIEAPIRERQDRGEWERAATIVDAERTLRGVIDEWDALYFLIRQGFEPKKTARPTCGYDWHVERGRHSIGVEVRGKAPIDMAVAHLHAYFEGLCLLPRSEGLRSLDWNWLAADNAYHIDFFSRQDRLARVVDALHRVYPALDAWIRDKSGVSEREFSDEVDSPTIRALSFRACVYVEIVDVDERSAERRLMLEGKPWLSARSYEPGLSYAKFELRELAEEHIHRTARLLSGLVLGSERQLGRKVVRAAGRWLFVVIWPVPFWWEATLASHPRHLHTLRELISAELDGVHPHTPLALWPRGRLTFPRFRGHPRCAEARGCPHGETETTAIHV